MDISIITALIAAVTGLITGAVGSLIAPWVHWGIEKRRERQAYRAKLISDSRGVLINESLTSNQFSRMTTYSRLKPFLSQMAVEVVEGKHVQSSNGVATFSDTALSYSDPRSFRQLVLTDITRLEKEWGLI